MAVTMKDAVIWGVTPYGSCKNRRFGGTYRLHHQGGKNQRARNNVSTLMIAEIRSSETTVLTRATRRHIPQTGILHTQYLTNQFYSSIVMWCSGWRTFVTTFRIMAPCNVDRAGFTVVGGQGQYEFVRHDQWRLIWIMKIIFGSAFYNKHKHALASWA
jgi:hypothetical protein